MDDDSPSSHLHPQLHQNLSPPQQRPLITAEIKNLHGNFEPEEGLFLRENVNNNKKTEQKYLIAKQT
jgi:hypothetical protein